MTFSPTSESTSTRDESRQWRTRPVLSVALTLVTVVVPVAASVAATASSHHRLPGARRRCRDQVVGDHARRRNRVFGTSATRRCL
jgi:hypothetical protein